MRFDLKQPCNDCPFIPGSRTNVTLEEGRIEGIVEGLRNDAAFICHKTLNKQLNEQQHCAGALIFLEKENNPNQMMRIAERFSLYDRRSMKMNSNIIDSMDF